MRTHSGRCLGRYSVNECLIHYKSSRSLESLGVSTHLAEVAAGTDDFGVRDSPLLSRSAPLHADLRARSASQCFKGLASVHIPLENISRHPLIYMGRYFTSYSKLFNAAFMFHGLLTTSKSSFGDSPALPRFAPLHAGVRAALPFRFPQQQ